MFIGHQRFCASRGGALAATVTRKMFVASRTPTLRDLLNDARCVKILCDPRVALSATFDRKHGFVHLVMFLCKDANVAFPTRSGNPEARARFREVHGVRQIRTLLLSHISWKETLEMPNWHSHNQATFGPYRLPAHKRVGLVGKNHAFLCDSNDTPLKDRAICQKRANEFDALSEEDPGHEEVEEEELDWDQ